VQTFRHLRMPHSSNSPTVPASEDASLLEFSNSSGI
jgi:hypothetical protein